MSSVKVVVLVAGLCWTQRSAHGQPVPAVEGRITVARGFDGGTVSSSADAVFARGSVFGDVLASNGPCHLHKRAVTEGLSAGTIQITGTTQPITLSESKTVRGTRYRHSSVPNPAFVSGATVTVEASGGSDLPAFTTTVAAPPKLAGYTPPTALSRWHRLTWAANPATEIMILIAAFGRNMRDGFAILCRVPDSGAFTIPKATLQMFPASHDRAIIMIARVAETRVTVDDARIAVNVMDVIGTGPVPLGSPQKNTPETSGNFVGFGVGSDVGTNGFEAGVRGRVQLGQRLRRRLHLVEEINIADAGTTSPLTESNVSISAGLRWAPFEPRPRPVVFGKFVDFRAFYVTAMAGANQRTRVMQSASAEPTEDSDWSPMASGSLGWMELQGRDWAFGPELRYQLAHHDGQIQHSWSLLLALHLF